MRFRCQLLWRNEGPATVMEVLGLTLDTENMVICIPQDKLHDIADIINKMIKTRKATSWEWQSLAGKLNFVTKAMPAGKSFIKHIYQAQAGVPHHSHIDLRSLVLSDLQMWKVFLAKFRGWMPVVDTKLLYASEVELFADVAGSAKLRWGAWLPYLELWMYGKWEENFFQQFNPSIDFLKLSALLARIITWAPQLKDCAISF